MTGDLPDDYGGDPVREQDLRILEALLFAAATPLQPADVARHLSAGADPEHLLQVLVKRYEASGVNLVRRGQGWAFRTAADLDFLLRQDAVQTRPLSRAALETLAVIAYHQPATRAEIEEIRGVSLSKGTLDLLLETGWVRMRGRRRTPGRPVTYGTTDAFLDHFGLEALADLPGLDELKGAGLLSGHVPAGFTVPLAEVDGLRADEDPLDAGDGPGEDGDES